MDSLSNVIFLFTLVLVIPDTRSIIGFNVDKSSYDRHFIVLPYTGTTSTVHGWLYYV